MLRGLCGMLGVGNRLLDDRFDPADRGVEFVDSTSLLAEACAI